MREISPTVRRKAVQVEKNPLVLVNLKIPQSDLARLDQSIVDTNALLGKRILNRSLVFREGAKAFMQSLRVQANKAKRGRLHAKVRRDIIMG